MKKFFAEYCSSSVNFYVSYSKRECNHSYSEYYDSENYAYSDNHESIERRIRYSSVETLLGL